jgi:hypothetical protein
VTTAYDPATAYLGEYQFHDFIEIGDYVPPATGDVADEAFSLRVKRFDASHPDVQSVAIGLGLTAEDTVLLAWNPVNDDNEQPPFNLQVGGKMILEDDEWVIQNFRKSRFGHYEVGVNKARDNADT